MELLIIALMTSSVSQTYISAIEVNKIEVSANQYTIRLNSHAKFHESEKNKAARGIRETSSKEKDSNCIDNATVVRVYGRQDQKALVIDLEGIAILPCHFCGASEDSTHKAMVWFKFAQKKEKEYSLWQAIEVPLDMHDDEDLNRVYVTLNHNLVIKDFQPNDVGTYFCEPYNENLEAITHYTFKSKHLDSTSAAGISTVWRELTGVRKVKFLYHLDIELPMKAILVSENGYNYPKPAAPLVSEENNWVAYTEWMAWGNCSVCGMPGKRQRRGQCMVKIMNEQKQANPEFLDHIFRFFLDGVPCHSSFFFNFPDIVKRNHETMIEECMQKCANKNNVVPDILDVGEIETVNTGSEVQRVNIEDAPEFLIRTRVGKRVILICPDKISDILSENRTIETSIVKNGTLPDVDFNEGKTLDETSTREEKAQKRSIPEGTNSFSESELEENIKENITDQATNSDLNFLEEELQSAVTWKNGSQVLSQAVLLNTTHGRVYINDFDYLNITNITSYDNQTFSCWQNNTPHARYRLMIRPDSQKEEAIDLTNHFIYLGISYIVNFIIFIIVSIFKHRKKIKQVKKGNKK